MPFEEMQPKTTTYGQPQPDEVWLTMGHAPRGGGMLVFKFGAALAKRLRLGHEKTPLVCMRWGVDADIGKLQIEATARAKWWKAKALQSGCVTVRVTNFPAWLADKAFKNEKLFAEVLSTPGVDGAFLSVTLPKKYTRTVQAAE